MIVRFPSLRTFSSALYETSGVAAQCLELQDRYEVSVNLLLWCCWLESNHIALNAARLAQAHALTDEWVQDYVLPLRVLRRNMKNQFGTTDSDIERVRQKIKDAELMAEYQLQIWLEAIANPWHPHKIDIPSKGENIRLLLTDHKVPCDFIAQTIRLLGGA